ncbi:MAG: thioredoxin-disulfide reductase [Alphaproteobacteria bacterium]
MAQQHHSKVLILGSGAAGYTAAIYAARANLAPHLVTGTDVGGQLAITTDVENYPGFADVIQGPWLMAQMRQQAEKVGALIMNDLVVEIDLSRRPFVCLGDSGDRYLGETLVIATGARARWLGLASEEKFKGHGVSACATCDGFFFRGKDVAVVGGGNTAVTEALYLANIARSVTLIHRRDELRAENLLQARLLGHPKVRVAWDSAVDEVLGQGEPPTVTGLRLRHLKTGATSELAAEGVFIAIGHDPATELFRGKLPMDAHGYLITAPDSTKTRIPGVFAAGDVRDKVFRQAVTAAGMGCMGALEAERFLGELEVGAGLAAAQ